VLEASVCLRNLGLDDSEKSYYCVFVHRRSRQDVLEERQRVLIDLEIKSRSAYHLCVRIRMELVNNYPLAGVLVMPSVDTRKLSFRNRSQLACEDQSGRNLHTNHVGAIEMQVACTIG
jgi:hypothetical protein